MLKPEPMRDIPTILIIAAIILLSCTELKAGPGDTTRVQTIDFNTPVNPGWNAPREGRYVFPPDSISFEKILMYYTLKCDPSQNPACGEWDYTTQTQLWYHTGQYDSNLYFHPNFIVDGSTPDTFAYMDDVSWKYHPYFEFFNSTIPSTIVQIGNGTENMTFANDSSEDGRHQFLFIAGELEAAGLVAGEFTGIRLKVEQGGGYFSHLKIRIGNVATDSLIRPVLNEDDLTTVYSRNTMLNGPGWQSFDFSAPFIWDGISDLIVDISYASHAGTGASLLAADPTALPLALSSIQPDRVLDFEGTDYVDVPADAFTGLDSAITLCFWQYGDPVLQPEDNSIFAAVDSAGNRVLNVHLPWSNNKVYWDAGNDNGYDRIYITLPNPSQYKARWNHWAFVKDCRTSEMKILLNGEMICYGWGRYRPMTGITAFHIGEHPYNQLYYDGMIDEFQIWDTALDLATITEWMNRSITPDHPDYGHLLAYYRFDEGNGLTTADSAPGNHTANLLGYPNRLTYGGSERVLNFVQLENRIEAIFEQGTFDPASSDTLVAVDTTAQAPLMVVMYSDTLNPLVPTDTLTKWPSYYSNYIFDPEGHATDSAFVDPDGYLYREDWAYYGTPYEILVPYEIGRYITPYGNGLSLGDGWTWIYDVTDFRPLLHDTVHLSAGNFQELLDLDFLMIEGTPPRDIKKIDRLWYGYYSLANFDNQVPPVRLPLDTTASQFMVKITTSGHEWDNPTNCAEFCEKTHWLDIDGTTRYSWTILDECADNPLYPQGGTWIYDRAGWCPGRKVTTRNFELTDFVAGDSVLIDYNCEPDVYGGYSVSAFMFSYGDPHFSLDAAVDEIIAPNNWKTYLRFNPLCGQPLIVIKNTGSTTLTSLLITYGPESGVTQQYTWTGTLGFMQSEKVILPAIDWTGWVNGNNHFIVSVSAPNGGEDEYPYNNVMRSEFNLSPEYPNEFVIKFKTNKAGYENRWEITDSEGNIIIERGEFENQTMYFDTVLLADGCYNFTLYDDGNDGISFWANSMGSGSLQFIRTDGNNLHGFNGDFGAFTSQSFTVGLSVDLQDFVRDDYFNVYPNPSDGNFKLDVALRNSQDIIVSIVNMEGHELFRKEYDNTGLIRDAVHLDAAPGIYLCLVKTAKGYLSQKLIISAGGPH